MYNSLRRRRATLAAQLIDLEARLSDEGLPIARAIVEE